MLRRLCWRGAVGIVPPSTLPPPTLPPRADPATLAAQRQRLAALNAIPTPHQEHSGGGDDDPDGLGVSGTGCDAQGRLTKQEYHRRERAIRTSAVSKSGKRNRLRKLKLRFERDWGKELTAFEQVFAGGVPRKVRRRKVVAINGGDRTASSRTPSGPTLSEPVVVSGVPPATAATSRYPPAPS
jgi:hypothetical protein